jgi:hypothetical protein
MVEMGRFLLLVSASIVFSIFLELFLFKLVKVLEYSKYISEFCSAIFYNKNYSLK